ncbi:MAG: protein phosphatase 2C domain-containing protein [Terracidiphilus sp.]|jgi:protein phosphatase
MLDVQFGQATDFGKVRTNNEDAMGSFIPASRHQTLSHGYLFAVADGVGGCDLGEVAAATAISVLTEQFAKSAGGATLNRLLPRLIQQANVAVHDCTLGPDSWGKKMATTVVACALRYDQAIVSHVGDSRCYMVRNGHARQITEDHTWVNQQRKMGLISASEMAESESRHVLIRSLGPEMFVAPDTSVLNVHAGDKLVLCSDGLHDEMSDAAIAAIVSQEKDVNEIARELVTRAVEIDGNDNTSAIVIHVLSVERMGSMPRGRPYRQVS